MRKDFIVQGIERGAINPKQYGGMVSREGVSFVTGRTKDFANGIETIATTEAPALVIDWERMEVIREVLPMKYMEAPNNDKVPFLDSHSRSSLDKIKGSARDFKTAGNALLCKVFISESEPIIKQKIAEGHIDSVSVGYSTDRAYTVEIPHGKTVNIDGTSYKNEYKDFPMVVRTWWKPHELSGVAIGADKDAKFKSNSSISNNRKAQIERKLRMALRIMEIELGVVNIDGLTKPDALKKLNNALDSAIAKHESDQVRTIIKQIREVQK